MLAVLHAPGQVALGHPALILHQGQQADAIQRIVGICRYAGSGQEGGRPVHGQAGRVADGAGRHARRPACKQRHADAAFEQVHLLAHERPGIGEALTAVVAGEDDERVLAQAFFLQRIQQPADAFVHVMDHALIGVDGAAVDMLAHALQAFGLGAVLARQPGPVRRAVVQREVEGLLGRLAFDEVHGAAAQQIGQVAVFGVRLLVAPEVGAPARIAVGEVVGAAGVKAVELLVARQARAEMRGVAQMPFADQGRGIAGVAQQRGHRGVIGRQAQHLVAMHAGDGLLGRTAQAVLPAARGQRKARGRAHRRVGVAAREAQALGGHGVQARRDVGGVVVRIARTGAAQVGIAEVIGQDEDQIGAGVGHERTENIQKKELLSLVMQGF